MGTHEPRSNGQTHGFPRYLDLANAVEMTVRIGNVELHNCRYMFEPFVAGGAHIMNAQNQVIADVKNVCGVITKLVCTEASEVRVLIWTTAPPETVYEHAISFMKEYNALLLSRYIDGELVDAVTVPKEKKDLENLEKEVLRMNPDDVINTWNNLHKKVVQEIIG